MKKILRRPRIIHLPHNIGNNVYPLSTHQKEEYFRSETLLFERHKFQYPSDHLLKKSENECFLRTELARWRWLWKIVFEFDIIHCHFGQTIATLTPINESGDFLARIQSHLRHFYLLVFQYFEILLYRLTKKKIYFHFQGDDVRRGRTVQTNNPLLFKNSPSGYYTSKSDEFKRRQIRRFRSVATKFYYLNPDLNLDLPLEKSTFVPYSNILSLPAQSKILRDREARLKATTVRVCHAPSNRAMKGTKYILEVMNRICSQYENVEFVLIEDLDHRDVLEMYRSTDLLIDQLLYGWYGAAAVESMSVGVPVMAFLDEYPSSIFPRGFMEEIPVLNVSTENLEEKVLEFMHLTEAQRIELSKISLDFVAKWHTPLYTATLIANDYDS